MDAQAQRAQRAVQFAMMSTGNFPLADYRRDMSLADDAGVVTIDRLEVVCHLEEWAGVRLSSADAQTWRTPRDIEASVLRAFGLAACT